MKSIKFPEVEGSKIVSSAPKVATCLQKRIKILQGLLHKFEGQVLVDLQKTFPS